jgi:hypothetical protein
MIMRYAKVTALMTAVKEWIAPMKVDLSRVVWTAVIAASSSLGSIASAVWGSLDLTLALGLVAITAAVMSAREVK